MWLLTSSLGRSLLAGVGIMVAIGGLYLWARHQGELAVEAKDAVITQERQKEIDDAQRNGPRTPDDVDKRLRDGRF